MSVDTILDLWRNALTVCVTVAAPFMIACLGVGLAIAVIQTATQLQENVLSFVPKLGAALLVIALAGHWMLDEIAQFTKQSISAHSERRPHP